MLKVALCDFNHTTVGIHTETMPLAIGLLAAYAQHQHPDQLDIRLFKFTEDFLDEIETWKPDVMGLSLYSWNTQLNLHIAQLVYNKFPHVIIVAGGPNIPTNKDDILKFFIRYPFVNLLIIKDGEIPFSRILGKLLEGCSREELVHGKLAGTITVESGSLKLLQGELGLKIRDLDQVPSPYLNGLMDKFFAYKKHTLAPFIETNRGCPFACTFCHTSAKYYNKIQWASRERLEQELDMFGHYFRNRHDIRLFLADNNFGSFKQDYDFATMVRMAQEKYNWPRYIDVTTGKTKPDNIIKVVDKLKWGLTTTASLQTLSESVLKNISRRNLKFPDFLKLQEKSKNLGNFSSTELIMCLPGETKGSFLDTIRQVLEAEVEQIIIYTLMNLNGTPMFEQHRRKTEEYLIKYRIVPLQFGKYLNKYIFDTEEVIVKTPTFSFEDYLYCRGFSYVIQAIYNGSNFPELIQFLKENKVTIYDWLLYIFEKLKTDETIAGQQFIMFLKETEMELWSSEDALVEFYSQEENYQKLLNGELGGNLLAKYTYLARFHGFESWLALILTSAEELLNRAPNDLSSAQITTVIKDFETYFINTRNLKLLFENGNTELLSQGKVFELTYDIAAWADNRSQANLFAYRKNHGQYSAHYSDEQLYNITNIASQDPNERSIKIQYILKGHARDFWATVSQSD